jgi:hypothetical protein
MARLQRATPEPEQLNHYAGVLAVVDWSALERFQAARAANEADEIAARKDEARMFLMRVALDALERPVTASELGLPGRYQPVDEPVHMIMTEMA